MTESHSQMELLQAAAAARGHAYAKYSNFAVGAALLADDGTIFTGCNVENSSFGLTICAERVAMATAVATGQRSFRTLALVTERQVPPCGACLQFLAEFCGDAFPIQVASAEELDDVREFTLGELLPEAFRF
jgi:cytidine deaminase